MCWVWLGPRDTAVNKAQLLLESRGGYNRTKRSLYYNLSNAMKMEETELWESPERVSIPAQGCVWNQGVLGVFMLQVREYLPN